jgi:hypothetical protein
MQIGFQKLISPNPTIVPVFNISKPTGLLINGTTLYVNSENNSKTYKVDLTQGTPTPVEFVAGIPGAEGLLLNGTDLYISYKYSGGGIKKVNINDPTTLTNVITNCPAGGMVIKNNELFFGESINGSRVKKFNLTTPNPVPTVVLENLLGPNGLTLNGNFVYVSEAGPGGQRIVRFDVTQSVPVVETVVSGLSSPSLAVFDGLDMYFSQEVNGKVSKLVVNTPVFNSLIYCTGSNNANLGGASPTGGTYSGPNITNNGNGETFTFTGGVGTYTVTYTLTNGATVTAALAAVNPPSVSVTAPAPVNLSAGVQMGWTGGTPMGGIYSGPGITDNGNGISYNFDPAAAGLGTHTLTYTYTAVNGCGASATATVTVTPNAPADDACGGATNINSFFGGAIGTPVVSPLYDNTNYNSSGDPATGFGCFYQGDGLQHTIWYTFTGDGKVYKIRSVQCNATNYIFDGDTQAAIYTGGCGSLTPVACTEDEDPVNNILNINTTFVAQQGVNYYMLVDGYNGQTGQFCLEVTNLGVSGITEIAASNIRLFPNPTTGLVRISEGTADRIQVVDQLGRVVMVQNTPSQQIDLKALPTGVYMLLLDMGKGEQVSARVMLRNEI